jgi:hypothetical protein
MTEQTAASQTGEASLPHPVAFAGVAIPIGIVTAAITIVLSAMFMPAAFVVPAAAGVGLYRAIRHKWTWLGLSQDHTVVLLAILLVVSGLIASSGLQVKRQQDEVAQELARVVALGRNDPAAQQARLATLNERMLVALQQVAPELEAQERGRRAAAEQAAAIQAQRQHAEMKRVETARALAALKTIPRDDHSARLVQYERLAALAPERRDYARQVAELTRVKEQQEAVRTNPAQGLVLADYSWSKNGFGSVMVLDAAVRNESAVVLKDFTIECRHTAPSGTQIDSNTRVVYERVAPGTTKRLRHFNMGFIATQAAATSCAITDAKAE